MSVQQDHNKDTIMPPPKNLKIAYLIDFFDSHITHDSSLMSFERFQSYLANLRFRFSQKLHAGICQHFLVLALYLHLARENSK